MERSGIEMNLSSARRHYVLTLPTSLQGPMMASTVVCYVSVIALVAATAPVRAVEQTTPDKPVLRSASKLPNLIRDDCEARIEKLDGSDAEGEERLFEKRSVIDACFNQYKHDKTIVSLVLECAKYEEQPVVKRQFAADCQLAAFKYGNELRALKAQYRK
jgi:hypothetical protein